jgi:hypothetical protein
MVTYGLIPEFVGRFPVIVPFSHITEDTLVQILIEPANSLVKQYKEQFAYDDITLTFTDCALRAIAKKVCACPRVRTRFHAGNPRTNGRSLIARRARADTAISNVRSTRFWRVRSDHQR